MESSPGKNGVITIKGKCELGNIYGGGLEIPSGDVHIQMDKGTSTKEMIIYASGSDISQYDPDNWFDTQEIPDPVANPAYTSGNVTIELINGQIIQQTSKKKEGIEGKGAG